MATKKRGGGKGKKGAHKKLTPAQERNVVLLFAGGRTARKDEVDALFEDHECNSMCKYSCKTTGKQASCSKACKFQPGSKCGSCLSSCKGGSCKSACMMACKTPTCKATCQWGTG